MQLVLYAKILEEVQGLFPEDVAIINRDSERVELHLTAKHREKTFACVDAILAVMRGTKPGLKLASLCKNSPWFAECVAEAEAARDIALVYRVDSRSLENLRELGIRTIDDVAAMDVDALPKIPYAGVDALRKAKVQAQSLLDKDVKWLAKPSIPDAALKLYFDIEGDPLLGMEYLFGFWVVGDTERKYATVGNVREDAETGEYFLYFLAEQYEDEGAMWRQFLAWTELLPHGEYVTYHYADYERSHTNILVERYGGSDSFTQFSKSYVDLLKTVMVSVVLPLYFYSIKDIAKSKFVNFKWRHAKAGGAQSIFWYEDWLEKGDRSILNDIVDYNEDDVRATKALHEWLL